MIKPRYHDYKAFGQYFKESINNKVFRWDGNEWILSTTTVKELKAEIRQELNSIRCRKTKRGQPLNEDDLRVAKFLQVANRKKACELAGITKNSMIHRCSSIFRKLGIRTLEQLRTIDL